MKKDRILNRKLNDVISDMGHGDYIIISDAGFPIPDEKRVDLAIQKDVPGIMEILKLIVGDFIYERLLVAEEQKAYNPNLYKKIGNLCDRCELETIPHEDIIGTYAEKAKYIVRTGAFEPWGNVVLCSGVDAPAWFDKEGVITPDYYQKRADYEE